VPVVNADDGTELAYRVVGDGPLTLTCLHSLALDGSWYEPFAAALGEITQGAYRCVIPDFRGHGRSGYGDRHVYLRVLARDVRTVWDDADVDTSAVFGVSLGGMVAQAVAATAPDRVSALLLAATTARFDDPACAGTRQRAAAARAPGGMTQLVSPTLQRWFTGDEPGDDPVVARAGRQLAACSGEIHADFLEAMTDVGSFEVGRGIPVLVLGGSGDRSTPRNVVEDLALGIPDAELDFVAGGHLFPFTHPADAARRVAKFLGERGTEVLP
jgi:3-oxoadipate enol-lactonase